MEYGLNMMLNVIPLVDGAVVISDNQLLLELFVMQYMRLNLQWVNSCKTSYLHNLKMVDMFLTKTMAFTQFENGKYVFWKTKQNNN